MERGGAGNARVGDLCDVAFTSERAARAEGGCWRRRAREVAGVRGLEHDVSVFPVQDAGLRRNFNDAWGGKVGRDEESGSGR